jgi:hypothetical protein
MKSIAQKRLIRFASGDGRLVKVRIANADQEALSRFHRLIVTCDKCDAIQTVSAFEKDDLVLRPNNFKLHPFQGSPSKRAKTKKHRLQEALHASCSD